MDFTTFDILGFINSEIPFNELKKNEGIFESNDIENYKISISIGVSFEDNDEDGEEVYIYNIFWKGEYININNIGNKEDRTPITVIDEIRNFLIEHYNKSK